MSKRRQLSDTLQEHPDNFDEAKISACSKGIIKVNWLPSRYHAVKTVYLSNNNLSSLEGVQQFAQLQSLSVVNNRIATVEGLAAVHAPDSPTSASMGTRCAACHTTGALALTSQHAHGTMRSSMPGVHA
jgi:Leucine-rich repeat (LRR) protein